MGRPTKEPKAEGRVSLGLRVTPEAKRKLDHAARKSGRSQSQEAEFRIEQSFRDTDQIIKTWGSREVYAIAGMLGAIMFDAIAPHLKRDPTARLLNNADAFGQALVGALSPFSNGSTPIRAASYRSPVNGSMKPSCSWVPV